MNMLFPINIYFVHHPAADQSRDQSNSNLETAIESSLYPGARPLNSAIETGQPNEEIQILVKEIPFVHPESGFSFLEYAINNQKSEFIHHVLNDDRVKKYINYKNKHSEGPLSHLIKNSDKFTESELICLIKRFVSLGANIHEQSPDGNLLQKAVYPYSKGMIELPFKSPNYPLITYLSYLGASSSQVYSSGHLEQNTKIAIKEGKILRIAEQCLTILQPLKEIVFAYCNSVFITEDEPLENDWIKI